MATNSLNLTTFCLEMRPEVAAATCIYMSIRWSKFKMDRSSEGRVSSSRNLKRAKRKIVSRVYGISTLLGKVINEMFTWILL
jgi:hypothetical protein